MRGVEWPPTAHAGLKAMLHTRHSRPWTGPALLLPWLLAASGHAAAQQPFYAGKTVTVAIGSGASGSHAQYGRLIARHMGQYLPGQPSLVPKYFPGAGGMTLANQMVAQVPKDGTTFALINRTIFLEPLIAGPIPPGSSPASWRATVRQPNAPPTTGRISAARCFRSISSP